MKHFWNKSLLALAALAGAAGVANAQGWDQPTYGTQPKPILSSISHNTWRSIPSQDAEPATADQSVIGAQAADTQPSLSDEPIAGSVASVGVAAAAGTSAVAGAVPAGNDHNWVVGTKGLFFQRDHEDDVRLTRNAAGTVFTSTNPNMNTMGGVQFDATRRSCGGTGLGLTYWGLYPSESFEEIAGPGLSTYLTGFNSVLFGGTPIDAYFNAADSNYSYRTNEFHNLEINFLRNVGTYTNCRCKNVNYELLAGFRWFQFNEGFGYGAFTAAGTPTAMEYDINTENTLLGFQIGGRSEVCLTDRLGANIGLKVGAFNNRINHRQQITDNFGNFAYRTAPGVDDYNFATSKDDLSMLGELDLGLSYRLSCCSRLSFGYRLMGISGIALAPNQIPRDFTLDNEINSINSNGNLILGGGYAGLEFCF